MAFRIRRGTNTDRLSITPDEGELLYTTDTENVYIGDGSTVGGNLLTTSLINDTSPQLSANLDLGGNNIVGTGNINIDGTITATGNINLGDGAEDNVIVGGQIQSSLIPTADGVYDIGASASAWRQGFFEGLDVNNEIASQSLKISRIIASDSTLIFDDTSGFITASVKGNVIDNNDNIIIDSVNRTAFLETLESDSIFGSLYGDDSTIIIDNSQSLLNINSIETTEISGTANSLIISPNNNTTSNEVQIRGTNGNTGDLKLLSLDPEGDLTSQNILYGRLIFERNDINGSQATAVIGAGRDNLFIASDPAGDLVTGFDNFLVLEQGNLVIGGESPNYKLDVRGEAVIESYVQFGSLTTSERDNLTPANGMVIYNTTVNRFQGYQADSWINLDDGTAA